jgi:hypothetical protein
MTVAGTTVFASWPVEGLHDRKGDCRIARSDPPPDATATLATVRMHAGGSALLLASLAIGDLQGSRPWPGRAGRALSGRF